MKKRYAAGLALALVGDFERVREGRDTAGG